MRWFFLAVLVVAFNLAASQQVSYRNSKVFRLIPRTDEQLHLLRNIEELDEGYSFWNGPSHLYQATDVMVPPRKFFEFIQLLNDTNIKHEIYIDDVQKLIDLENPVALRESGSFGWTSYHTVEEIYAWLDELAQLYPDNVQVVIGGWTYEGREIKGVKLTFKKNNPSIFIEGGIHAREWISSATVTYLINELLTSKDPAVRELAESNTWYMFPLFNPDGYVHTQYKNRLWRKTRSRVGSCRGADANRNWGYKWMTGGASNNPCSDTFAGTRAFSEVETKTLSRYIESISSDLYAYISFHSYSQLLLQPYGHTSEHLDNYQELHSIGLKTVATLSKRYGTKYKTGNIPELLYVASGSSMDWAKGVLRVPIAYTYELRDTGRYGFLLPANQIIPTAQETLDSLVALFKAAKAYGYPSKN